MNNKPEAYVAFVQSLGVAAYIILFVSLVTSFGQTVDNINNPLVGMTFALLAFVTSALICGSMILGYPIYLFMDGNKKRAVKIVAWSAAWLLSMLLIYSAVLVSL